MPSATDTKTLAPPAPSDRPSVAILPFATSDANERHLAEGITDDIIVELSRFRDILVISQGSSFRYDAFADDLQRVAAELRVRYMLTGRVRRLGQQLRITAQLIDSESNLQIWSERLDEMLDDVLSMQAAIAARVVGSVIPEMLQAEQHRAARLPIGNVPAYEMALKGGNLVNQGIAAHDPALLSQGIAMAEAAAALDPLCLRANYATAYGYCRRGTMGYIGVESNGDLERAMAAALRLRDLEPRSHMAYAIIGHIDMRLLRHESALINLRQAHALNANDVTTLRWLSWEESNHGMAKTARAHAEQSLRISPRDRFLDASYWALALAAYVDEAVPECIELAQRAIALNRRYGGHHLLLAAALAEAGQTTEAGEVTANLVRHYPGLLESRLAGRSYFVDPMLTARYRAALRRAAGVAENGLPSRILSTLNPLSSREQEVLRLIAQGLGNTAVAAALDLSEHTVKRHVANILTKLALPTRAAAVAHASRTGLL